MIDAFTQREQAMELLRIGASEQLSICLVALLAMSFVLPMLAGNAGSLKSEMKRSASFGQCLMGLCGLAMIAAPGFSIVALLAAATVCAAFAVRLQQLRSADLIKARSPRR